MPKKWTKKHSHQENWTQAETQKFLHERAKKAVDDHKKEAAKKQYKKVPILHGYKLVEIKNGES